MNDTNEDAKMKRTEEQLEAIGDFTAKELADLRKFQSLPEDAVGMDGISKDSCYINGTDTAKELGITLENGFAWGELCNAFYRFTVETAKLYDLI